MPFAQALLAASLAGITATWLSGLLVPGNVAFALLFMLAPLPLYLAGLMVHPLLAALAGLIGALLLDVTVTHQAALVFSASVALPAYLLVAAAERAYTAPIGGTWRETMGSLALGLVVYVALMVVASAFWIEPDYARILGKIREIAALTAQSMLSGGSYPPELEARLVDTMSGLVLPMTGLILIVTLALSAVLGVQIASRARRLGFAKPDFRRFRLPGGALILMGLAGFMAFRGDYVGVLAAILLLGTGLMLMLQGLAVIHQRSLGMRGRGFILGAAWALLVFFGFPAFLFIAIGIADHLLNFRNPRKGGGGSA